MKLIIALLLLCCATPLYAEEPPRQEEEQGFQLAIDRSLIPANEKKTIGEPRVEKDDVAIERPKPMTALEYVAWVPRIVFFPVHLVLEYGVRRPLGAATVWAEKNGLIALLLAAPAGGWVPIVSPRFNIRSGFIPVYGLNLTWNNAIFDGNDFGIGFDFGQIRTWTFEVEDRVRLWDDSVSVGAMFEFARRNDLRFHGIGSDTSTDKLARFFREKATVGASLQFAQLPSGIGASSSFLISGYDFKCTEKPEDICGADRKVGGGDDPFRFNEGGANFFDTGFELARLRYHFYWDSRDERPANGSGVRVDINGEFARGMNGHNIEYVKYGGEVAGFWDVYRQRVIGMRLSTEFADSIGDGQIPFTELSALGGIEKMRGFSYARFYGRSTIIGTIDYRYPIWSFLDANVFFEVGNAFDTHLEDFELGALRPSAGLSLKTVASRYNSLDFTLGFGGHRFDSDSSGIDDVRVGVGTNWGF